MGKPYNLNIIHRVKIDLSFNSGQASVSGISREIDTKYKDKIISVINDVVGKIETDENIFIDRIDVDLDRINNEESFIQKLRKEFQDSFDNHIGKHFLYNLNDSGSTRDCRIKIKEGIIDFLKTGVFNWNALEKSFQKNKQGIADILKRNLKSDKDFWLNMFVEYPAVFIRVLMYFKECKYEVIIVLIQNIHHCSRDFKKLFSELSSIPAVELSSLRLDVFKRLLSFLRLSNLSVDAEFSLLFSFVFFALQKKIPGDVVLGLEIDYNALTKLIFNSGALPSDYKNRSAKLKKILTGKGFELSEKFYTNFQMNLKADKRSGSKMTLPDDHDADLMPVKSLKKSESISLHVPNSGIVLLHPFFIHLFDHLKLLKKGQFKNESCRLKAVQLLHYLSALETDFTESDIIFSKILCGYSIEQPLAFEMALTKKERDDCYDLLKVVIKQWTVLKNTSPEGLIEAYIKRDGILNIENKKITLVIEKKAADIMLDRLPWGISVIKFSWIDEVIYIS